MFLHNLKFAARSLTRARPGQLMRQVFGRGMILVAIGLALGLGSALASSRLLSSLLIGISAADPLTYLGAALSLLAVAALAIWLPSRRASQIEPMGGLRAE